MTGKELLEALQEMSEEDLKDSIVALNLIENNSITGSAFASKIKQDKYQRPYIIRIIGDN